MKNKILFLVIFSCLFFSLAKNSQADTHEVVCSGDITTALTNATKAASDGDIINIGAGSCTTNPTWDNRVAWTDKNITLQGQGHGNCSDDVCTCNPAVDTCITGGPNGFMNGSIASSKTDSTKMAWRITNIFFTSSGNSGGFGISNDGYGYPAQSPATSYGWRVDNVTFYYPNTCGPHAISIFGLTFGLIDHNYFVMNCESTIIYDGEFASEDGSINNIAGAYNLSLPFQPGGLNNIYIEDNVFVASTTGPYGAGGFAAIDSGYRGGRVVFRHNTLTNAGLYSHWTQGGGINTQWWEVYNNKFSWTWGGDWLTPMRIQGGGTGLIYNNTFTGFPVNAARIGEGRLLSEGQSSEPLGYCDDTPLHNWDGNAGDAAAPGWPCLSQTGRVAGKTMAQIQAGEKQTSFPLYLWNNGPQDKCYNSLASGSNCDNSFGVVVIMTQQNSYFKNTPHVTAGFGNGDVDYSITANQPTGAGTHTLIYAPLQYPHPLTRLDQACSKGDFDCNTKFDALDISSMINIILKLNPTSEEIAKGDLNTDNKVDSLDLNALINEVLK